MDKTPTYETKDIITATFLKVRGHYCIGTVSANNKYRPNERLWLFEDSDVLQSDLQELESGDPLVPVKKVFSSSTILKNLLNDKDEF